MSGFEAPHCIAFIDGINAIRWERGTWWLV